jgi:hypothetical protein
MGCYTKNAKVVAISLGSLQRLIAMKAIPPSVIPPIIATMSELLNQGVDIQLRILQTVLSLLMNFPDVHGELLGDVLPSYTYYARICAHITWLTGPLALLSFTRIEDCRCVIYSRSHSAAVSDVYIRKGS